MKRFLLRAGRILLTLAIVSAAGFTAQYLWNYYMNAPWTRDGRVRADVVQVTPDVSGLVTKVLVHDNERVRQGQLLFVLDRPRYELALAQAEAALAAQQALLAQAVREDRRNHALGELVSSEIEEQGAARVNQLQAAVSQAASNRDVARLNLERTAVTAAVDGSVTNVSLRPGDYIAAGHPAMALVDSESLHVDGYFEETKLDHIQVGDQAEVRLMGVDHVIPGRVESIATGIADRDRDKSGELLANVTPTFTWVRLAQRIPVRISLEQIPLNIALIVGRTATVTIVQPKGGQGHSL